MKTFKQLNESEKQDIASAFLSTQAVINQSQVVDYILSKAWGDNEAPLHYDDITNCDAYGYCEELSEELTEKERDEKLYFYEYLRDKADSVISRRVPNTEKMFKSEENYNRLDAIVNALKDMDFDSFPEIFQWFLCSDYLIHKLEERGECTLDNQYWGRQTCGQPIVCDYVIQKIAYDYFSGMQVLPADPAVHSIFNAE